MTHNIGGGRQGAAIAARISRILRVNGAMIALGALLGGFIAITNDRIGESLLSRVAGALVIWIGGVGVGIWMIRLASRQGTVSAIAKSGESDLGEQPPRSISPLDDGGPPIRSHGECGGKDVSA